MSSGSIEIESLGFLSTGLDTLDEVVREGVVQRAFPGAVVSVGRAESTAHLRAFGRLTYESASSSASADTIYDLSSLTKVVAATTVAMILFDEGLLDLDSPVARHFADFRGGRKDVITIAHLLSHSSGLPAWRPLYEEAHGQEEIVARICAMDLEYEPGAKSLYSDLDFILLGALIDSVVGARLDSFAHERVFEPLGMRSTFYRPDMKLSELIAPTEDDPRRGRLLRGEVHDGNAHAMGGVSAHAGLFGTAGDLSRFARMMLNRGALKGRRIVSAETVARFTRRTGVPGSTFALGWDTPSRDGSYSTAGSLMAIESFGHVGYTGTSLWIDPTRDLFVVLLTNRVHPSSANQKIRAIRPAVADAAVRALK